MLEVWLLLLLHVLLLLLMLLLIFMLLLPLTTYVPRSHIEIVYFFAIHGIEPHQARLSKIEVVQIIQSIR